MPDTVPTDVAHLRLLNCARGHFWESAVGADGDARETACPTCGAPADVMPLLDPEAVEAPLPPPAPTPIPPPYQDRAGQPVVAGYEVLEDLGRSAAGVALHRAKQTVLNRTVVLKSVLARDDPSQHGWGALRAEAAALAKLPHPNVVGIFEAGDRDRQLFYNAVELVEGPSLAKLIAEKPLPVPQALALVEVLARAVHFAHEKGVVHRGLRPQAVLLHVQRSDKKTTETPEPPACTVHNVLCIPKITGFGLAKARLVEGDVTDQELQDKFPCYLSPEQAWGRSKEIGPATDIYALGAVLYECLTGQPPFRGSSPGTTLEQIQTIDPLPIASLRRGGVPADVEAIVRRCLHKQPRRRYASARELADDLRRAAEGRPSAAREAGLLVRSGQWARRNPTAFVALVVVLLALVGLVAATVAGKRGVETARQATRQAETDRDIAHRQLKTLEGEIARLRGMADTADYFQQLARAELFHERHQQAAAQAVLDNCPSGPRGVEWYLLRQRVDERPQRDLPKLSWPVTSLAWSADGKFLAASAGDNGVDGLGRPQRGEVCVWAAARGTPLLNIPVKSSVPVRQVAFHPEGKFLAWATADGLTAWDLNQGKAAESTRLDFNQRCGYFCWTPDGRSVLVTDGAGNIPRLDFHFNKSASLAGFQWGTTPGRIVALSNDGTRYAAVNANNVNSVGVFEEVWPSHLNHPNAVLDLAYHPGSSTLATACADGQVRLWRPPFGNGVPVASLRGHTRAVTSLSFTADGKRLVSCGADGTVRIWDMESKKEVLTVTVQGQPIAVACSPNGEQVAVAANRSVFILGAP
jgi:WD40 repeat protein